ncbi:Uu.00g111930.m01.CDS01 [Anthostomella pinea]|uniref:Uu.00g111930.m01.CDS01 n=1 Tax=Anthostomella pinea TaxID=933095 RepID=A0AAI8VF74_9PEZI|nr:Uu.00g111930.m01.CDS01 [Anthostomella pinea]
MVSASHAHPEPFNSTYPLAADFPKFGELPKELRLQIWESSLQRHRIIKVTLSPRELPQDEEQSRNCLGRAARCARYRDDVRGHQVLSKLLTVNSEARQAALQFYRVHVPCSFYHGDISEDRFLPFNPEFDFLHIRPGRGAESFAYLVHDLKTYDPLEVGLLNLAMDGDNIRALRKVEPSRLDAPTSRAFEDTMSKLRQFYYLCVENAGRVWLGYLSGVPAMRSRIAFHRSCPIWSKIPTFDLVPRDTRPCGGDLQRVFVGTCDPREMVIEWRQHLDRWGIRHRQGQIDYSVLISCKRPTKRIRGRDSARQWLREEQAEWEQGLEEVASSTRQGSRIGTTDSSEEIATPAVGFWLFPTKAIGPFPDTQELMEWNPKGKRVLDMMDHWPGLGLSHLP